MEPLTKKAKRTAWSDNILLDPDILRTDEVEGMFVFCKYCKCKGTSNPLFIKSQTAFGEKAWKKHKASNVHNEIVGKSFTSIKKFFPLVEKSVPRLSPTNHPLTSLSNKPFAKACTGIYDVRGGRDHFLTLMVTYGVFDDLEVSIKQTRGVIGAFSSKCTSVAVIRRSNAYYKSSCAECYKSLKDNNSDSHRFIKRVNNMSTIQQVKKCLSLRDPDASDIDVLKKIGLIRRVKKDDNDDFELLKQQAHNTLKYFDWRKEANGKLQNFGLNVKGTDDFLANFYKWYTEVPQAKDTLCMGFVQALVARHKNPSVGASKKVIAFCQAMKTKSTKAYKFLMANGFGYSVRSLQRICRKQRQGSDLVIDTSNEAISARVNKYSQVVSCSLFGLAIDATKVAKCLEVNTAYGVVCGAIEPNHARNVNEMENPNIMNIPNDEEMATEIKCAILTVQSPPKNASPFKLVAARPQSTNERCDDFNMRCILAAQKHGTLLSVAFDGLSAESYTIRNFTLNFLEGRTQTIALVDPNHVGKCIRSQLVLGGSFTTIGATYFDVGLLKLAGVPKNVYRVDDFASDAIVLELCSKKTIEKISEIVDVEDRQSLLATTITLLFLCLFIVASNSSCIPKRQAIAIVWASLLYFTSINISITTKRNIGASAIPIICLLAQKAVTKIRLMTSEPAEHYFGCARQKKREFTVSDFVSYAESLEIALREMVQYDLRSGGGSGYVSTFSGFLRDSIGGNGNYGNTTVDNEQGGTTYDHFLGVDVDYNDANKSIANQIEEEVLSDINASTESMLVFLKHGMGIDTNEISIFGREFKTFKELAKCYYYYLPKDLRKELQNHVYANPDMRVVSREEQEQDATLVASDEHEDGNISIDTHTETLRNAFSLTGDEDSAIHYSDFVPNDIHLQSNLNSEQSNLENDVLEEGENVSTSTWNDLTNTLQFIVESNSQMSSDPQSVRRILSMASNCMGSLHQKSEVSISDAQKYNSLKGRWWGKTEVVDYNEDVTAAMGLKRGQLFKYNLQTYKIINVFGKSYNKWRIENVGKATAASRLQAVAVLENRFVPGQFAFDMTCEKKLRHITLSGNQVVPFAYINMYGWSA